MKDDKRILLHVCCGPCAEWPILSLLEEGYQITSFFSNPNIHPVFEQTRRRDNAAILMKLRDIPFVFDDEYREDLWLEKVWESKTVEETYANRCDMCYHIRMTRAAEEAVHQGFPAFTTSLLVSPYQDHERLMHAAQEAADAAGVIFVYRDFRPGYRKGQDLAREHGIYRQKYCGCIASLLESAFYDKIVGSFEGSIGDTSIVR